MAFLKVFLLCLSLFLLPGCDTTRQVQGEIMEYHADAEGRLTGLTVRTEEGETMTFVPEEDEASRIVTWLGADTLTEIQAEFPNAVLVSVQHKGEETTLTQPDGTRIPAIVAEWVLESGHLETEQAYTFSDGVSVDLWDQWPGHRYLFPDRRELLIVEKQNGPENTHVSNVDSFDTLSPQVQEKVLAFYEEQGMLYDELTELEKVYSFYKADPENFSSYRVGQNTVPIFSNEHIFSFLTTVTTPLKPGYGTTLELCHTFDRETGELISNYDLFTAAPEEILPLLLSYTTYEHWENAPSLEEMQGALKPEYIHLSNNYIGINFPAGSLPDHEHGYGFSISLFGQEWDALQPWAQPAP